MMNKLYLTGVLQAIFCFTAHVHASEVNTVTINYSGLVVAATCEVKTNNVDIIFKDAIGANTLATLGDATDWNSGYSIELVDCEPGSRVSMTMAGTPDKDIQFYKNEGTAENVMIELSGDEENHSYQNGYLKVFDLDPQQSDLSIPLKARLLNNGHGPATPGQVKAIITASFIYN
ncbi:fimbrial protein [Lelliottia nimipressuralis]|uniref:Type 1 fimbrial protein n=1 Tax=Lelliottia nimipressuralis TaxID=69220 RepID=A0ABY3NXD6_9ENTR|nr:fimbrial protein [Lelliottia nimipressuralis]RXJ16396.1 type 1 fimbrial protein [Lelliottia nimipressuralis]TYT29597.1 type 1 fimbrial protein [Lelliottia nimipressuralis]